MSISDERFASIIDQIRENKKSLFECRLRTIEYDKKKLSKIRKQIARLNSELGEIRHG